jgi:hypothetical protein
MLRVRLPNFRKDVLGDIALGESLIASPSDFLAPDTLVLTEKTPVPPAPARRSVLLNKDPEFLRECYPVGESGLPRFYSQVNEKSIVIAPAADADYVMSMGYFFEPQSIVDTNTSWLGDHFAHALLSGSLVEACMYMKTEDNLYARYSQAFEKDLAMDQGFAKGRTKKDTYQEPDATFVCSTFKLELLKGLHNFETDLFRIALYDAAADINANTINYVTEGEVAGVGYTAGGQDLVHPQVLLHTGARIAYVTFDDAVWSDSVIVARAALIYNQSAGQRAVAVLDFGTDRTSNHGPFHVQFPPAGPSTALVRVQ